MKDRLKQLRSILKLNQKNFGEKIGLAQNSIAGFESGKNKINERNFNAICNVFNVNSEWLKDGVGEIFNPPKAESYLDKLAIEKGLSPADKLLIQSIIDLPPEARSAVIDWACQFVDNLRMQAAETPTEKRRRELQEQIAKAQQELAEIDGEKSLGEESSVVAGAG